MTEKSAECARRKKTVCCFLYVNSEPICISCYNIKYSYQTFTGIKCQRCGNFVWSITFRDNMLLCNNCAKILENLSLSPPKGWQCPICGTIMSPFVETCVNNCGKKGGEDDNWRSGSTG